MSSTYKEANQARDLELLVVAKTYPHPSMSYDEIVCTGGITAAGEWIRLYPLPFRYLDENQTFKKYQWISCRAIKHSRDPRPESYRPVTDSIKLGRVLSTESRWQERKELLMPHARQSMEEISARWHETWESVGMFRPKEVVKVLAVPDQADWSSKHRQLLAQGRLFGKQPKKLEKIPWRFKYVYRCDDPRCDRPHEQTVRDWEVFQLYRNARIKHGEQESVEIVKGKLLELFGPKRDSYLIVGTVGRYPSFIIGAVFYPPKTPGETLSLWEPGELAQVSRHGQTRHPSDIREARG
jgi:hypothetical protein